MGGCKPMGEPQSQAFMSGGMSPGVAGNLQPERHQVQPGGQGSAPVGCTVGNR